MVSFARPESSDESIVDNDIFVEEDFSDVGEFVDEPVFGPVVVDDDGEPICEDVEGPIEEEIYEEYEKLLKDVVHEFDFSSMDTEFDRLNTLEEIASAKENAVVYLRSRENELKSFERKLINFEFKLKLRKSKLDVREASLNFIEKYNATLK